MQSINSIPIIIYFLEKENLNEILHDYYFIRQLLHRQIYCFFGGLN